MDSKKENSQLTIKEGYKQTDVGIIPEDWSAEKIENVAPLQRGFDLPNRELRKGDFPVVYSNGILNFHNEFRAKAPGVVTGRSGTIGKVNFIEQDYFPHNTSLWVTDFKNNHPKFIYYLYIAVKLERFGTGSGVPTLNRNDVHLHKVAIPPLAEQQAIAEVLSDVDALVTSLDALLTKKRNIKQGTMQLLLTGKKRLPNFSGDWETKKLGEIADFYSGGTPSTSISEYYNGNIFWITSSDLNKKRIYSVDGRITKKGLDNSSAKMVEENTLLIALYGATAGVTAISKINAAINQAVLAIIPNKTNYVEFLYYKLESLKDWIIITYTQGGQPNLSGNIIKSIELDFPTKEEQNAIAQTLSDMDAEIEALENQRDKYKAIKQGMMQELLTGKTRLV